MSKKQHGDAKIGEGGNRSPDYLCVRFLFLKAYIHVHGIIYVQEMCCCRMDPAQHRPSGYIRQGMELSALSAVFTTITYVVLLECVHA